MAQHIQPIEGQASLTAQTVGMIDAMYAAVFPTAPTLLVQIKGQYYVIAGPNYNAIATACLYARANSLPITFTSGDPGYNGYPILAEIWV